MGGGFDPADVSTWGPQPHYLRVVEQIRPGMVIIENVPQYLTGGHYAPVGEILYRMGYEYQDAILGTAESVGASHKRERVFILAVHRCYDVWARIGEFGTNRTEPANRNSERLYQSRPEQYTGGVGLHCEDVADTQSGKSGKPSKLEGRTGVGRNIADMAENRTGVGRRRRGDGIEAGDGGQVQAEGLRRELADQLHDGCATAEERGSAGETAEDTPTGADSPTDTQGRSGQLANKCRPRRERDERGCAFREQGASALRPASECGPVVADRGGEGCKADGGRRTTGTQRQPDGQSMRDRTELGECEDTIRRSQLEEERTRSGRGRTSGTGSEPGNSESDDQRRDTDGQNGPREPNGRSGFELGDGYADGRGAARDGGGHGVDGSIGGLPLHAPGIDDWMAWSAIAALEPSAIPSIESGVPVVADGLAPSNVDLLRIGGNCVDVLEATACLGCLLDRWFGSLDGTGKAGGAVLK